MADMEVLSLPIEPERAEAHPGDIWYEYRPEKPRLLLALDQDSVEAMSPLFENFRPGLGLTYERVYDHVPGLAIATLASPHSLYPTRSTEEKMDAFFDVSREFHDDFGYMSLKFTVEDITQIKLERDRVSVIGVVLRDDSDVLSTLREQLLRNMNKLMSEFGEVHEPKGDWLDCVHEPLFVLPVARPYKGVNRELVSHAIETARSSLPETLSTQPTLCLPETVSEPSGDDTPPLFEYTPLSDRALAAAIDRPYATVEYHGALSPLQRIRARKLGNLVTHHDQRQNMLVIRAADEDNT